MLQGLHVGCHSYKISNQPMADFFWFLWSIWLAVFHMILPVKESLTDNLLAIHCTCLLCDVISFPTVL